MINLADIADQLEGWFGAAKADAEKYKADAEQFLAVHAPGLRSLADATADDLGKLALGAGETVIPAELRPVVAELVTKFVQAYLNKPAPAAAPEPDPDATAGTGVPVPDQDVPAAP